MRRLDRYIFRQIAGPFLFFVLIFTGTVWLGQSLKLVETIVNNSQSARVFLELTLLVLPTALSIVLPVACFAATVYAVNRLFSDSEIVVMFATGFSWTALLRPVCMFAGLVMLATYALTLGVIPTAQGALKTRLAEIRHDIVTAFLHEGAFESPAEGVTVYLRGMGQSGEMLGLFVHDTRDRDETATYTAERAVLVSDETGTRIVMLDGVLQLARARDTETLSILRFKQFAYDLSQFMHPLVDRRRKPSEYYLPELFAMTKAEAAAQGRPLGGYVAEAHEALSAPLYAPVFALIAVAFVVGPGFRRRGFLGRILAATGVGLALRLTGLSMKGLTIGHANLWPAIYLPPLVGVIVALWLLSGRRPLRRRKATRPGTNGAGAPA